MSSYSQAGPEIACVDDPAGTLIATGDRLTPGRMRYAGVARGARHKPGSGSGGIGMNHLVSPSLDYEPALSPKLRARRQVPINPMT